MRLRPAFAMVLLVLAALGMSGPCGPSWAHSPFEPEAEVAPEGASGSGASEVRRHEGDSAAWTLAPAAPRFSWWTLAVVSAVVAFGWRRPRRAAALALALFLAVFAFEDGLHSVHHGLDQAPASSCPVAAAGTHLSATAVDGVPDDVILSMVALSVETSPSDPVVRPTNPEQGRAPPRSGSVV